MTACSLDISNVSQFREIVFLLMKEIYTNSSKAYSNFIDIQSEPIDLYSFLNARNTNASVHYKCNNVSGIVPLHIAEKKFESSK